MNAVSAPKKLLNLTSTPAMVVPSGWSGGRELTDSHARKTRFRLPGNDWCKRCSTRSRITRWLTGPAASNRRANPTETDAFSDGTSPTGAENANAMQLNK